MTTNEIKETIEGAGETEKQCAMLALELLSHLIGTNTANGIAAAKRGNAAGVLAAFDGIDEKLEDLKKILTR